MDGPCEEATRENLSFVAEQVSHHPPSKSTCGKLLLEQVYWLQTNKQFFLKLPYLLATFKKILILITVLMFEVDQFKTCNWFVKIFLIYPISVFTRACHVLYMHADVQRRKLLGHDMRSLI